MFSDDVAVARRRREDVEHHLLDHVGDPASCAGERPAWTSMRTSGTDASLSDGEGLAEALERDDAVPDANASSPTVPHTPPRRGPWRRRVADLAGAGFASPGHVGHLDLAEVRQAPADQLDEVPLPIWAWYRSSMSRRCGLSTADTRASVSAALANGSAGVVDGGVEVLEAEGDPVALAERGDASEGPGRRQPHVPGHGLDRPDRQASRVEPGAVQVEAGHAEPSARRDRLSAVAQQLVGAVGVTSCHGRSRSSTRTSRPWRRGRRCP